MKAREVATQVALVGLVVFSTGAVGCARSIEGLWSWPHRQTGGEEEMTMMETVTIHVTKTDQASFFVNGAMSGRRAGCLGDRKLSPAGGWMTKSETRVVSSKGRPGLPWPFAGPKSRGEHGVENDE